MTIDARVETQQPAAWGIRSTHDGSWSNVIAVCGWSTFEYMFAKLQNDPWIINGRAMLAAASKGSAT
jgi:hypothetical protein